MRTTEKLGYELLKDPFRNKGTAFTEEERRKYGLVGLLPPRIDDIESQSQRIYRQMTTSSHSRSAFTARWREKALQLRRDAF